jgi:hypothetical protein
MLAACEPLIVDESGGAPLYKIGCRLFEVFIRCS